MTSQNLLIASSPMQILNGIEAIKHFGLNKTILVLLLSQRKTSHKKNNEQIEEIAKLHNWKKIIRLEQKPNENRMLARVRLIQELKKVEYQFVFIGNYTKTTKIIIANIKKKHLYLVDDGTVTILIYNEIILKNKMNDFSFKNIMYFLYGLKTRVTDKLNLFTYFDLERSKNINIVKNNLNYFKGNLSNKSKNDNNIIFLGQNLAETHTITIDDYKAYINSILSLYDEEVIYIPHRYEEISKTVLKLESEQLKILQINLPVELYLIYNNITPKRIISFCTSAFFTLDKIYPETAFEHIVIPQHKLLKNHEKTKDFYKSIENETSSRPLHLTENQ